MATARRETLNSSRRDTAGSVDLPLEKQMEKAVVAGDVEKLTNTMKNYKKGELANILDTYQSEEGEPLLHLAVENGHLPIAQLLISKGSNVNQLDSLRATPLIVAAMKGKFELCDFLLSCKKLEVNSANIDDTTALHYLARHAPSSSRQIVELTELFKTLIKKKASVNVQNNWGETPLHQATKVGNSYAINILHNEGADLNADNKRGETALHYAVMMGNESAVEQLMQLGVDRNRVTKEGDTALDLSVKYQREYITEAIRSFDSNTYSAAEKQRQKQLRNYTKMVMMINHEFFFARALSQFLDQADADAFAKALVHVTLPSGTTLPLIRDLVQNEFSGASDPTAILRGNSIASKVMGLFSRSIGQEFLKACVGDTVLQIINNEGLDFEMDPSKVPEPQPGSATKAELLERHRDSLLAFCRTFLNSIMSDVKIALIPREIRAQAGFIAEFSRQYCPDRETGLVGGFIMLRLFNPTLVTPESFGVLPMGKTPSPRARRNLVMITKVVQQLSNNVHFGLKEEYMISLNEFLTENSPRLAEYLAKVAQDPMVPPGAAGWEDCKVIHSTGREPDPSMLDFQQLTQIHRMLHKSQAKLKTALDAARPTMTDKNFAEIQNHLKAIAVWGNPPANLNMSQRGV